MRHRRTAIVVGLATIAAVAVVACTLNPQPLPPSDFASAEDSDASADSGRFADPTPSADAGAGNLDADGGADAASDAGDAGDAATDADGG